MESKISTGAALKPYFPCLEILKIYSYYEENPNSALKKSRKLLERHSEIIRKIPLLPIDISDIENIRNSGKSILIYKNGISFYYVEIPENLSISSHHFGNHKCSRLNEDCDKLYALPEEMGGCQKVLEKHPKIENFSWITQGFQTINCIDNRFFIAKCEHFEHTGKRKKMIPHNELKKIRRNLADLYLD